MFNGDLHIFFGAIVLLKRVSVYRAGLLELLVGPLMANRTLLVDLHEGTGIRRFFLFFFVFAHFLI